MVTMTLARGVTEVMWEPRGLRSSCACHVAAVPRVSFFDALRVEIDSTPDQPLAPASPSPIGGKHAAGRQAKSAITISGALQ